MLNRLKSKVSPRMVRILRILFVVVLLLPVLLKFYKQWLEVKTILVNISWSYALIGLAVLIMTQPLMGLISWLILRGLKQFFSYLLITALYFISQAAKYLPGGIWAFPGRVIAYQTEGVEKLASFISLVQEVGALFFGAVVVGIVGLVVGLAIPPWMTLTILVGIGLSVIAMLMAQLPITFKLAARYKLVNPHVAELLEERGYRLNFHMLPAAFLVSILFWLLVGLGFRYLTIAVAPVAAPMTWLQAASLFALAWCAGFVIVIAPSGIGVREAALAALLAGFVSSPEALSIALVARLWWMAGEFGYIGLSLLWMSNKLGVRK